MLSGQLGHKAHNLGPELLVSGFVLSHPLALGITSLIRDLEPKERPQEMESNLVIEQQSWRAK